ncbi:MAG: hypothetical protein SNF33_05845 [Candidatus Algichlamydia australiensis]|nr:hypothetical protein [Chlamydiales bacterium]
MACTSESLSGFREKRVGEKASVALPPAEMFSSRLDENIPISKEKWAVTLIVDANSHHARLIFEGLDKVNQLWTIFVHLTGNSSGVRRLFQGCSGAVEMKDITGKPIKFGERSNTWEISASSGKRAVEYIQSYCSKYFNPEDSPSERAVMKKNEAPKSIPFFITGNQSLITKFINDFTKKEFHSCITFSLHVLRKTGITFENPGGVLFTDTLDFVRKTQAKFKKTDLKLEDLCWFIADDDIESIREHFPPEHTNVNQIIAFHPESQKILENLSPLMASILYGREDIFRMLVEEYGADVKFASEIGLTPLFIALVAAKFPFDHPITTYLISNGSKNLLANEGDKLEPSLFFYEGIGSHTIEPILFKVRDDLKAFETNLIVLGMRELDFCFQDRTVVFTKIKTIEETTGRKNLVSRYKFLDRLYSQLEKLCDALNVPSPPSCSPTIEISTPDGDFSI